MKVLTLISSKCWFVVIVFVFLVIAISERAVAAVCVSAPNKSSTSNSITSCNVTITVTIGVPGPESSGGGPAPVTRPSYTLDLWDDDVVIDDAVGVDKTGGPNDGVGWTAEGSKYYYCGIIRTWAYTWEVPCTTLTASDGAGNPDPYITVTVTGPGGGTVEVGALDLSPVATTELDFGVQGPSYIANSDILFGESIAGFSRGYDQISSLGSTPALYFVSDQDTQLLSGDIPSNKGQVFILDQNGDLWHEELYGGDDYSPDWLLTQPRYLNVNTAAEGVETATEEMYFVSEGSSIIEYTPDSNLENTQTFLDLEWAKDITAIAVEDNSVRGEWDSGDVILFAEEDNPAIFKLAYGSSVEFLNVAGHIFDGSTVIDFDYLDDAEGNPIPTLTVGNIMALSAAGSSTPTPSDRIIIDVFDCASSGIPTLSEWGLIIFMTLMMGIGVVILYRRRIT